MYSSSIKHKILLSLIVIILLSWVTMTAINFQIHQKEANEYEAERKLIVDLIKRCKIDKLEYLDLDGNIYLVESDPIKLNLWQQKIYDSKRIDYKSDLARHFDDEIVGYVWLKSTGGDVLYTEILNSHLLMMKMSTDPEEFRGLFRVFGKTCSVTLKTAD